MTPLARLRCWLLHLANADPPMSREPFYRLKDRLCRRYGSFDGHDLQHLVQPCWGSHGERDEGPARSPAICSKCGGTGIYRERWVRLERWRVETYLFHRPVDSTSIPPIQRYFTGYGLPMIEGYVQHQRHGRCHAEACLWLYLLCGEWRLWWHTLTTAWASGWYGWPMLPMLLLQRLASWSRVRTRRTWPYVRQRCNTCGRRFWRWEHGWLCRRCRQPRSTAQTLTGEDLPF